MQILANDVNKVKYKTWWEIINDITFRRIDKHHDFKTLFLNSIYHGGYVYQRHVTLFVPT